MREAIRRDKIFDLLNNVEQTEIACSLLELGMIIDVALDDDLMHMVIALPMINIPEAVRDTNEKSISGKIGDHGLELKAEYFQMVPEVREKSSQSLKSTGVAQLNPDFTLNTKGNKCDYKKIHAISLERINSQ